MGLGTRSDYNIESHAHVQLENFTRVSDGTKINTATVTAYLCEPAVHPDADSAADFANPGEVGIAIAGHNMAAGDYIISFETINYDFYHKVLSSNTNSSKIFFAASQVAETFSGNEDIFKEVEGSSPLSLVHSGGDPDGYYSGAWDDQPVLVVGQPYFRIIKAVIPGTNEVRLFVDELIAKYG